MAASNWQIRNAVRYLKSGGILAHPTEAVFGLACDPLNAAAVAALLDLKQRPLDKGLILIADRFDRLTPFLANISDELVARVNATWPGPVTWLLPSAENTPSWLTGKHSSLAVRVTNHPLSARLCNQFNGALVSTSANLSGHPAPKTQLGVRIQFKNHVTILNGSTSGALKPSAIYDGLTLKQLR